jgi:hypothetical protein
MQWFIFAQSRNNKSSRNDLLDNVLIYKYHEWLDIEWITAQAESKPDKGRNWLNLRAALSFNRQAQP